MWNKELIRLKCEAKLKGGFYVDPEAMFLVIIIVMNPKSRIILQLLCLRLVTYMFYFLTRLMFFITQWIGFIFYGCWLVTSLADWEICQGLFVLNKIKIVCWFIEEHIYTCDCIYNWVLYLHLFVFALVFEVLSFLYTKYIYRMCFCDYIFFMSIVWIVNCSFETYVWNKNFVLAYIYCLNSKVIETIIKFKVIETIMIWILLIWFDFVGMEPSRCP